MFIGWVWSPGGSGLRYLFLILVFLTISNTSFVMVNRTHMEKIYGSAVQFRTNLTSKMYGSSALHLRDSWSAFGVVSLVSGTPRTCSPIHGLLSYFSLKGSPTLSLHIWSQHFCESFFWAQGFAVDKANPIYLGWKHHAAAEGMRAELYCPELFSPIGHTFLGVRCVESQDAHLHTWLDQMMLLDIFV